MPAAGVVGEAMVAFVLADAYRSKFGGDHIDDVLGALARLPGADRVAIVLIGFMGAGKTTAAARARGRARAALVRQRRAAGRAVGHPVAEEFERDGEAGLPGAEEAVVCELLDRRRARRT